MIFPPKLAGGTVFERCSCGMLCHAVACGLTVSKAYHSGVEVFGGEYVFGGGNSSFSGVTVQRPKVPPAGSDWTFSQSIDIAPCRLSRDDAMRVIQELRAEFPASGYDLMARNCNHFSEALCQRLCNSGMSKFFSFHCRG